MASTLLDLFRFQLLSLINKIFGVDFLLYPYHLCTKILLWSTNPVTPQHKVKLIAFGTVCTVIYRIHQDDCQLDFILFAIPSLLHFQYNNFSVTISFGCILWKLCLLKLYPTRIHLSFLMYLIELILWFSFWLTTLFPLIPTQEPFSTLSQRIYVWQAHFIPH